MHAIIIVAIFLPFFPLPTPPSIKRSIKEGRPLGSCSTTNSPANLCANHTLVSKLLLFCMLLLLISLPLLPLWLGVVGKINRLPLTLMIPPPLVTYSHVNTWYPLVLTSPATVTNPLWIIVSALRRLVPLYVDIHLERRIPSFFVRPFHHSTIQERVSIFHFIRIIR